jgi:hypothetical protein
MLLTKKINYLSALILATLGQVGSLHAVTTVLFDGTQAIQLTSEGTTSDTYTTEGYIITVTHDKLYTGGGSVPIGRSLNVLWPEGMNAQGLHDLPDPNSPTKATLSISRVDGLPFALNAFSAKLLGSTASGGGSIEVTPVINDGPGPEPDTVPFFLNNPNYGQLNSFNTSQNAAYTYNSSQTGGPYYDKYKFTLYVDYAITSLTLVDASSAAPQAPAPPAPAISRTSANNYKLAWPGANFDYTVQTCTDLTNNSWGPYVSMRYLEGNSNVVNVVSTDTQRYFRLAN